MAKAHIRFDDEIEEYEPSDSETEYTEREKTLLKKVRTKRKTDSDSEEEVYRLEQSDDDDDDDDQINDSDIDGQDDDDIPDVRAWGKSKRDFYSTDYIDPDYGGFQGKDAVSAELEEEEARNIQKRLAEQMDDADFTLDIFNKKPEATTDATEEVIRKDLSSMSKRQLLELLRKESPEFFELIEDYKDKMKNVRDFLAPVIELDKNGKVTECKALEFVRTMYHLVLNYCTNIYMYLLLKASRVNVQNHPIIKRLYQYRQLLAQLEPAYIEIIKPQLQIIIDCNKENDTETAPNKKSKKLKLLKSLEDKVKPKPVEIVDEVPKKKKVTFENDSESERESEPEPEPEESLENDSKRAITYEMKKNKGLTPHRKKEQRNPRVKHRNKFRKAKIRRKGAVREVRKELSRYGGEMSGIKSSVTKSIKIK